MAKINIDKQITRFRKQNGLTQEQLAAALNVSNQAVSKWESGQCCPDISLLPEISDYFGITVDELLGVSAMKNAGITQLAEHIIEMSVLSWNCGLISLIEYTEQAVNFPFLKTAVNITISGENNYKTAEDILKAAAGDDRVSQLISDCILILMKGSHPTSIIQVLEGRLSQHELVCLKLKRPVFFLRGQIFIPV